MCVKFALNLFLADYGYVSKYLIYHYSHPALSGESKTRCFKCPKELYALVSQHFYKLFSMHFYMPPKIC